jgi:hypothetical protein
LRLGGRENNDAGQGLVAKKHNVIPAKAGIQFQAASAVPERNWIPAFAGMTLVNLAK